MGILRNLHRDAKLLMASRGIRAFAFSYLNVIFAIYLDRLGYTPVTISPTLSAYMMQAFALHVPILVGGGLQLFHDCIFYFMFRDVKPPEEQAAQPQAAKA